MRICSVCHRISGSGEDHIDCVQLRRVELESEDFKSSLPERLDLAKDPQNLGTEIRAILEHLAREKGPDR